MTWTLQPCQNTEGRNAVICDADSTILARIDGPAWDENGAQLDDRLRPAALMMTASVALTTALTDLLAEVDEMAKRAGWAGYGARERSRAVLSLATSGAASVPAVDWSRAPAQMLAVLGRAESFIAGFEDDETQAGVPALLRDLRAAAAGQPAPENPALAVLRQMREAYAPLHDAVSRLCEGDEVWSEERRLALADMLDPACNAADHLAASVLAGQAAPATPDALDALTRIVGERIFGDGTDACEQRVIDLCLEAQKAHGITRESWAKVLAGGPCEPNPFRAFVERVARFTTLEDEFNEDTPEGAALRSQYEDVEDYRSDLDDERLCSEFTTFEETIRDARAAIAEAEGR